MKKLLKSLPFFITSVLCITTMTSCGILFGSKPTPQNLNDCWISGTYRLDRTGEPYAMEDWSEWEIQNKASSSSLNIIESYHETERANELLGMKDGSTFTITLTAKRYITSDSYEATAIIEFENGLQLNSHIEYRDDFAYIKLDEKNYAVTKVYKEKQIPTKLEFNEVIRLFRETYQAGNDANIRINEITSDEWNYYQKGNYPFQFVDHNKNVIEVTVPVSINSGSFRAKKIANWQPETEQK